MAYLLQAALCVDSIPLQLDPVSLQTPIMPQCYTNVNIVVLNLHSIHASSVFEQAFSHEGFSCRLSRRGSLRPDMLVSGKINCLEV